jgi:hypothetical protein
MGVPTSEVGYTSATTGRETEVHDGHVVALEFKKKEKKYRVTRIIFIVQNGAQKISRVLMSMEVRILLVINE